MSTGPDRSVRDNIQSLLAIDALDFQKRPSSYMLEIGYLEVRFAVCVYIVCNYIVRTVRKSLHGSTCVNEAARFLVDTSNAEKVQSTSMAHIRNFL
jgi:hypothetical protein